MRSFAATRPTRRPAFRACASRSAIIFLLYALVVPFVTGLFFLILTFQKANALTLLRAIGAPSRRLVQIAPDPGLRRARGRTGDRHRRCTRRSRVQRLGDITLRFETRAVVFWSVLLLAFGSLSSLFSARRVLAIDPVAADHGCWGGDR